MQWYIKKYNYADNHRYTKNQITTLNNPLADMPLSIYKLN